MGGLRTRGPLGYLNIPISCKGHATAFFVLERRKAIVKVVISHLSPSNSYNFLRMIHHNILNLNKFIYCVS
jgi:hypothetical protein